MYAPVVSFYNCILEEFNIAPALPGDRVMARDPK